MKKQYCYSFDGEYYESDLFDSKEKAIEEAKKEAKKDGYKILYLGIANEYKEYCGGLAENVADILQERAVDKCGEFAKDYMRIYNKKHLNILEERIKKVILDFQKEFNHEPDFYTISDIEEIEL